MLAIVAAKLGWAPVLGVDHELAALEAAAANADANGVEIEFERTNLREEAPPSAPTMVANLTAPLLRDVAANLAEPPERLITLGPAHRRGSEKSASEFGARPRGGERL